MKRMFLLVWAAANLISLMPLQGLAAEHQAIHFVSEAWEGVTNADGTGLCWELFRKIYEPGIRVEFEIMPYARATKLVQTKEADASVGVYLNEFEDALFSKWHYLQDRVLVIFRKGTLVAWDGEKSLSGNLGWIRGYAFDQYLRTKPQFFEVDRRESGLKMLEAGRLDFFLDTEEELLATLKQGIINQEDYQIETVLKLNIYLAFAENERGRELLKIFDDRMEKLGKSRELFPIYQKWGFESEYPFDEQ